MKRYVLMGALLVSMFTCPAVFCQEFEPEDMELRMALRERQMELQRREAEMDFDREMRELELEERRLELDRAREGHKDKLHPLLLLCLVVHILVAVWVYTDIRRLNRGSGIWIVIAILTGLLGALVYAVVRLGDNREKQS